MEITTTPPHITLLQRFDADTGTRACWRYLPEQAIDSYQDLLRVLGVAFEIQLDDLCICVRDMLASVDREVQAVIES